MLEQILKAIDRWLDIKQGYLDVEKKAMELREKSDEYYRSRPQTPTTAGCCSVSQSSNETTPVKPEARENTSTAIDTGDPPVEPNKTTSSAAIPSAKPDQLPEPITPDTNENGNVNTLGGLTDLERLKNDALKRGIVVKPRTRAATIKKMIKEHDAALPKGDGITDDTEAIKKLNGIDGRNFSEEEVRKLLRLFQQSCIDDGDKDHRATTGKLMESCTGGLFKMDEITAGDGAQGRLNSIANACIAKGFNLPEEPEEDTI